MKTEEKQLLTFGIAALFRAATIAGNPGSAVPSSSAVSETCISAAREFIAKCEDAGVLPKELP